MGNLQRNTGLFVLHVQPVTSVLRATHERAMFRQAAKRRLRLRYRESDTPLMIDWTGDLRIAFEAAHQRLFGFVEPEQAAGWIKEYYDIIKSDQCVPLGYAVNANIACGICIAANTAM